MADIAKQPTVVMSADGKQLFQISAEYRKPVRIEDVPQRIIDATLAAEDKRFYQHEGIDYPAMVRQLLTNYREGRIAGGGSTLTMQLAKRVYTSPKKTIARKIEDMALASKMEEKLTKNQILELYLNQVYYGSGAFGIKAAADVYFGKPLDHLTHAEAALLARLVRRPSQDNPFVDMAKSKENRDIVLGVMREEGWITPEEYRHAVREKIVLRKTPRRTVVSGFKLAPYFVDYVLEQISRELPDVDVSSGGYRIETTINLKMQELAEKEVAQLVRQNRGRRVTTAAFLLCDRDGRILAMVGGVDYKRNQFNATAQGRRQPGSAFKPFVYAAAFELGELEPTSSISNERFVLRDSTGRVIWSPKNSSGRYGGRVSVRSALTMSLNIPAVRVMDKVGPHTAVSFCRRVFGFTSPLEPYLSMVLGSEEVSMLEMAQGYSVFMLGGERFRPFGIRSITGPDGSILVRNEPEFRKGVLSANTAQIMDGLLRGVVTSGTARRAGSVVNARGKTGTTSDNKDAWFIGYTDELIGVGWIANELPNTHGSGSKWVYHDMGSSVFGGTVTVQMWRDIVGEAQRMRGEKGRRIRETAGRSSTPQEDLPKPDEEPVPTDIPNDEPWVMPPLEPSPDQQPPAAAPPGEKPPTETPPGGTPEAPPRPERRPDPPVEDSISVETCADSGMRANSYCPERIRRSFPRGSEPRKRCPLHGTG